MYDIIMVEFYDHAEDFDAPVRCRVIGELEDEDDLALYITNWTFPDPDQEEELDPPTRWVVLKSTIYLYECLKPSS